MQFNYGNLTIDTAGFHPASLDAMIRRGVAHFLGNEMAAKVTNWEEGQTKEGVVVTDEMKAAKKAEFQGLALTALSEGTVGVSNRAPRVDPITGATQAIAKREVLDILKANGLKAPKGDEAIEFANGQKKTLSDMISTRVAHPDHGPRIAKEAARKVADDEKKAAKAKADAAKRDKTQPASADALGL